MTAPGQAPVSRPWEALPPRRLLWVGGAGDPWLTVSRAARTLGCEAVPAPSLSAARAEAARARPGLVLVHWKLALSEGDGARARLGLPGVPLLLVVDRDTPAEVLESAEREGVEDCLVAPVRASEVAARLAALSGEWPLSRPSRVRMLERHSPRVLVLLGVSGVRGGGGLGALLEACGHHLLYASTVEGAAARVAEGGVAPHLVLLQEDGLSLEGLARLRTGLRAQPWLSHVPVVLLTSRDVGVEEGVDGMRLSTHTLRPAALLARIHGLLGRELSHLRVAERMPFCCPVEFRASGPRAPEWLSGFSTGVSPGCLFVRTWVPARPGVAVALRIHLPTTREVLEAEGVVAWAHPQGPRGPFSYPHGMGVQFLGMGPRRLMHLRQLCRAAV